MNLRLRFEDKLTEHSLKIRRTSFEILQLNLGKKCNQACHHCHVEAGPLRTESMEKSTMDRAIELVGLDPEIHTVDLTGGAPELNPNFRYLVTKLQGCGKKIIDRCNLTVLFERGQEDTAKFLSQNAVQIVASLPCYSESNVNKQRGGGVFEKSIRALQLLNDLGYAKPGSDLILDLVYNPVGPNLPPAQKVLEETYKIKLLEDFGIYFNKLYTITNMPIKRFLWDLEKTGQLEEYMALLIQNFNPAAAQGVMCRNLLSISWDGFLYDCDFNQMLHLPLSDDLQTIWDIDSFSDLLENRIAFGDHCFGCTAGSGSSCKGALT